MDSRHALFWPELAMWRIPATWRSDQPAEGTDSLRDLRPIARNASVQGQSGSAKSGRSDDRRSQAGRSDVRAEREIRIPG